MGLPAPAELQDVRVRLRGQSRVRRSGNRQGPTAHRHQMKARHPAILGALLAAALGAVAVNAAEDSAAVLARHGIQEYSSPVRQDPTWRKPRKVLLLDYGLHP